MILFINPPNRPYTSSSILIEPIDLLTLATLAESDGFNVSIIDMDASKISADTLLLEPNRIKIVVIVLDFLIPLHADGARKEVLRIAAQCQDKKIPVILCGKEMLTSASSHLFQEHLGVNAFQELTTALRRYRKPTHKHDTPASGFDLVIPNRNLINPNLYIDVRTLLTSTGCHLKCNFCHVPNFWRQWKSKTKEQVLAEIQHLVWTCHAKKILFLDDNMATSTDRLDSICRTIVLENFDRSIRFGALASADRLDRERLELMKKAGFSWVHVGAETGSEELLRRSGKKHSILQLVQIADDCKDIGLRLRTSWIIDLPGQDKNGLKQTEELIERIDSEEVRLHFLSLRAGSTINEQMKNKGIMGSQYIHSETQNVNLTQLSPDEISTSQAKIIRNCINSGYAFAQNTDFFQSYEQTDDLKTKIVSTCPMRYGIGWN